MKIVKITGAKFDTYWYAKKIDTEFIVKNKSTSSEDFEVVGHPGKIIDFSDCEILGELKGIENSRYEKFSRKENKFGLEFEQLISIEALLYYNGDLYEGREVYTRNATIENALPLGHYYKWSTKMNCPLFKSASGIFPGSILNKVKIKLNPIFE